MSKDYKHQPTSPRVLIVEPKLNDPKNYPKVGDIVLPTLPANAGLGTSPAAVGKGITTTLGTIIDLTDQETKPKLLAQADEAEVFGDPTKENKFWVLQAMGFAPRGNARWYHPVFGEDLEWNYLLFDLETDDLKSLPPKLYRTGWAHAQRNNRMQFKKVLNI